MAHDLVTSQLDSIAFDGAQKRPRRDLIAETLTMGIALDLNVQVDVAAGGGADGTLVVEQPDTLVPNVRIFDGDRQPIVEVSFSEIRQFAQRRVYGQAAPGVILTTPTIQAASKLRRHAEIWFSNPRSVNPVETALKPRDLKNFYIEIEWVSTDSSANGAVAAALITGGTRTVTPSAISVDIAQIHDPVAYLKTRPLYLPRIRRYEYNIPATTTSAPAVIKTGADAIRMALLHTLDAGVTTESIINAVTLRDDRKFYREVVKARTLHEAELQKYAGLENISGQAMAYFGFDFANNGKLGTLLRPYQGGNLRFVLDVTGSATRIVRLVQEEYERIKGITTDDSATPAALLD